MLVLLAHEVQAAAERLAVEHAAVRVPELELVVALGQVADAALEVLVADGVPVQQDRREGQRMRRRRDRRVDRELPVLREAMGMLGGVEGDAGPVDVARGLDRLRGPARDRVVVLAPDRLVVEPAHAGEREGERDRRLLREPGRRRLRGEDVVGDLARAVERERGRAAAAQGLDRRLLHPGAAQRRHRILAREQHPRGEHRRQRARRGAGDDVDDDPLAVLLAVQGLDPDHERAHRPSLESPERGFAGQHQGDAELGHVRTSENVRWTRRILTAQEPVA